MAKNSEYTISLKYDGPKEDQTSESIAEQTAAFLKSGGEIAMIPSGVSGQISLGEKARIAKEEEATRKANAQTPPVTAEHPVENTPVENTVESAIEKTPDSPSDSQPVTVDSQPAPLESPQMASSE